MQFPCDKPKKATGKEGNTKPPSLKRYKALCGTWNNYDNCDYLQLHLWASSLCSKWIIAEEVGKEGTPHLQFYLQFKKQEYWNAVKLKWPKVHFEAAKGGPGANFLYCSKDGKYIHDGFTGEEILYGEGYFCGYYIYGRLLTMY